MLMRMLIHSAIFTVLITVGAMGANAAGLLNNGFSGGFSGSSFSRGWDDDHDRRSGYGRGWDRKWEHDDD